ncbi:MAG: ATP-binding cassette domain-containing protein [Clostridia bacterium]|nr:ATP-binding cassette domain-containing protein [Clostridia bacterium]
MSEIQNQEALQAAPSVNDDVLLRVEHLCQYFKVNKAVDDVSFDIKKGEVFGLVGESGCGKTTTGRSIIKLYDITDGNIYFRGKRIAAGIRTYREKIKQAREEMKNADPARKEELRQVILQQREEIRAAKRDHFAKENRCVTEIQMIFQDPIASLDPRMTVYEIIAEGLKIRGERDKSIIDEKVFRVLERVGLVREHAGRYPHEFSGGQRQRIGVARAVVMEPEIIIADEPVSALDVSIQAQVINLLNELRNDLGLTILFIAHDLSVVKYFSDRIGVMYYGKMVELATSDELFAHPLHPYTRALLSAIPLPDPNYEKNRVRVKYNPLSDHDYSVDKPSFREVAPGHFVMCNDAEFDKYIREMQQEQ